MTHIPPIYMWVCVQYVCSIVVSELQWGHSKRVSSKYTDVTYCQYVWMCSTIDKVIPLKQWFIVKQTMHVIIVNYVQNMPEQLCMYWA